MTSIAQRGFAVALAILATMTLAGCGASSIATTSYAGFPTGVEVHMLALPQAFADDTTLHLVLAGSSSCPTVPTAMEEQEGGLVVTVSRGWAVICAADMTTTTVELAVESVPDHVVVSNGDDQRTIEVHPAH